MNKDTLYTFESISEITEKKDMEKCVKIYINSTYYQLALVEYLPKKSARNMNTISVYTLIQRIQIFLK